MAGPIEVCPVWQARFIRFDFQIASRWLCGWPCSEPARGRPLLSVQGYASALSYIKTARGAGKCGMFSI